MLQNMQYDWLFYYWLLLFILDRSYHMYDNNMLYLPSYQYNWKLEEAEKNILRTHTTAISARMLYHLGQQVNTYFKYILQTTKYIVCQLQEKFVPSKYFSIDRVFRNEAVDATHLAEFHQIEGLVADYNLTLGDLMGSLHNFFSKMGETACRVILAEA